MSRGKKMSKRRTVFFLRETMRKEKRWNLRWFFFFCLSDFTQRLQFSWLPEMLVSPIRKNRILVSHPSLDPITRRQTDRSSSWRRWGTTGRKWMREEMRRERNGCSNPMTPKTEKVITKTRKEEESFVSHDRSCCIFFLLLFFFNFVPQCNSLCRIRTAYSLICLQIFLLLIFSARRRGRLEGANVFRSVIDSGIRNGWRK